jgi:hypothetical protein
MIYEVMNEVGRIQFYKIQKSKEFKGYDLVHYDQSANKWFFIQNFDQKSWTVHWINQYQKNMHKTRAESYVYALSEQQ